jgi:hypothetical protein
MSRDQEILDAIHSLQQEIFLTMSALTDAVAAQTTAVTALTAAVAAIPNDSDEAAAVTQIDANTAAITAATTALTGDVTPTETPLSVPDQTVDASVGTGVNASVAADGGTPPYAWTAATLSSGLVLDANGTVTGTAPTAGTFTDTITVTDSESTPATASGTLTTTVS